MLNADYCIQTQRGNITVSVCLYWFGGHFLRSKALYMLLFTIICEFIRGACITLDFPRYWVSAMEANN